MAKGGVEEKAPWLLTGGAERGRADGSGGFRLALSGRKERRRLNAQTARRRHGARIVAVGMTCVQRGFGQWTAFGPSRSGRRPLRRGHGCIVPCGDEALTHGPRRRKEEADRWDPAADNS
jgi:hypothetical protein